MYRHATWFDYDLFHHFHDLIKKREVPTLIPEANDLTIVNIDNKLCELFTTTENTTKEEVSEQEEEIVTVSTSTGVKMQEKEIAVSQLTPGMTMGQTVLTKSGMLVVKNETALDEAIIRNMKQLESTGQIPSTVTILFAI